MWRVFGWSVLVFFLWASTEAKAEWELGVGLQYGAKVGGFDGGSPQSYQGFGVKGHFGYSFLLGDSSFFVQPEISGAYSLLFAVGGGNADYNLPRLLGGIRVGMGKQLRISLFGHAGYGWVLGNGSDYTIRWTGVMVDSGVCVEYRFSRSFGLGGVASYHLFVDTRGTRNPPTTLHWLQLGLFATMRF